MPLVSLKLEICRKELPVDDGESPYYTRVIVNDGERALEFNEDADETNIDRILDFLNLKNVLT